MNIMQCGIFNVIESLNGDYEERFQTHRGITFRRNSMGDVIIHSGNNVVIALLESDGSTPPSAIRCHVRAKPYLHEIYGENYYPNEFRVTEYKKEVYVDVVITPWIEGKSLAKHALHTAEAGDRDEFTRLSKRFDLLAEEIVNAEWSHGDINCENIVISPDGDIHLIDFDGKYIPALEGKQSCELGRAAYQSPLRRLHHFDSRLDDYSLAITSISLAALSIDPNLYWEYPFKDSLLLDATRLRDPRYPTINAVINLFEEHGYAAHAVMARELRRSPIEIEGLPELFNFINHGITEDHSRISTYNIGELWGYYCVNSGKLITPPLFSLACEFSSDEATVYIGKTLHKIDRKGEIIHKL